MGVEGSLQGKMLAYVSIMLFSCQLRGGAPGAPFMRNYIKYFAYRVTAHSENIVPTLDLPITVIGRTTKEAGELMAVAKARNIQFQNPARIWTYLNPQGPLDYFFKLNKELVFTILSSNPGFWWDNTIPPDSDSVVGFQDNVTVEKSPRSSFPTKQGTDGQRLRSGRSKDEGAALNYIGKLYFLTSKTVFKTIWNKLSAGKLSTKEALAQANALL
jgi:hypothetical protein